MNAAATRTLSLAKRIRLRWVAIVVLPLLLATNSCVTASMWDKVDEHDTTEKVLAGVATPFTATLDIVIIVSCLWLFIQLDDDDSECECECRDW